MDSENYQSLNDPHLNAYFNNKRIRRHLIKAGFINRHGDILPPVSYEVTLARRAKRREAKTKLPQAITNYVIEEDRKRQVFFRNQFDLAMKRSRIQKIREHKHPTQRSMSHSLVHLAKRPRNRNARTPSPTSEKRSPIRAKSAVRPLINVKNQVIHRPMTAKQQVNDEYCRVTMIYYGPPTTIDRKKTWYQPNGDEIVVMQQHCGGENLQVFKGFVRANESFTFDSRRHPDYPFALALYINGYIDSRISVCCEYKHKCNVRLGSKHGLFGIYNVERSQPCRICRFEQRKKKILSGVSGNVDGSPYRRSILTSVFRTGALLRTPTTSLEREKTPSKREINRTSTLVQAGQTPRTLSPTSLQNKDESKKILQYDKSSKSNQKKDESKKSPRISSSTSSPSSPDTSSKNEEPHHSSEPILTRKSDDDDKSSNTSRKSAPSPIHLSDDEEDDRPSLKLFPENKKTNGYSTRSSSSTSSSSIALVKTNDNHALSSSSSSMTIKRLSSSSSSTSSETKDNHSVSKLFPEEPATNKQSSRSSSRHSKISEPSLKNPTEERNSSSTSSSSTDIFNFFKLSDKRPESPKPNEDNQSVSKLSPEELNTNKQSSRSSSRNSKISDSSSENQTNEKLIHERKLSSTSSSSTDTSDNITSSDKRPDSPQINENNHRSSVDSEQINDVITQNPVKVDTTSSDDDEDFKLKRKRRDEEPLTTNPEKTPGRQYRAVENLILVWLDATIDDTNTETINSKYQLRQVFRTVRTFNDPTKCLQLFKEIKNEKIFLIISGSLSENILEQINNYSQLVVVYIFCQDRFKYEYLIEKYSKIKGIYNDISIICEHLKIDSKQWDNDLNTFEISSMIDQLLFIQNQLFKTYLLDIQSNENSIEDFIEYCEKLYIENDNELQLINQFKNTYQSNEAIQWYTKDCFIYHMINRAIRMKDIKILFQMAFFIRDINQQIEEDYSTTVYRSTLTVYRGQGIKMEYFEELKENQGGLLSFNGFVSTSKKQSVAYEFAQRSLTNGFPVAILFRIKIDPKTTSSPFISLENLSSNPAEYEILLSFKSIFHIEKIDQIENNLWQIDLILTDEISSSIQNEDEKFHHLIGYEKLGELLIEMNELDKAKDLYEINIPSITDPKYTYVYNQLALICTNLEVYNQAILYYNLSLRTKSNEILNDYGRIANIHNEIGKIFYKENKYREALEKFQYALNIQLEHLSPTDFSLINTYNLLALIYEENDDYETALDYHQKQLHIQEQSDLIQPSDLALTHFKIGICLENLDQLDEAMDHIQQSIDISPSDDLELNGRQAVLERIRELIE